MPAFHQFNGMGKVICTHFACGRQLTLIEQMAGAKCTQHMGNGKTEIISNNKTGISNVRR